MNDLALFAEFGPYFEVCACIVDKRLRYLPIFNVHVDIQAPDLATQKRVITALCRRFTDLAYHKIIVPPTPGFYEPLVREEN